MKDPLPLSLSLAVLPGLAPLLVSLFPMASILYSLSFMLQMVRISAHPDI
jgi:hypothetical protein